MVVAWGFNVASAPAKGSPGSGVHSMKKSNVPVRPVWSTKGRPKSCTVGNVAAIIAIELFREPPKNRFSGLISRPNDSQGKRDQFMVLLGGLAEASHGGPSACGRSCGPSLPG